MTDLECVLAVAREEIGVKESPAGSNIQKYGAAYGLNGQPWCVIFLWWCFQKAGCPELFYNGGKCASCAASEIATINLSNNLLPEVVE